MKEPPPLVEKTTRWTDEELYEIRKRRHVESLPAYELDAKGRPIQVRGREWAWQGHLCPEYEHCHDCVEQAADEDAAVMGGMLTMAMAIRARYVYEHQCSTCARIGDLCRICCGG